MSDQEIINLLFSASIIANAVAGIYLRLALNKLAKDVYHHEG